MKTTTAIFLLFSIGWAHAQIPASQQKAADQGNAAAQAALAKKYLLGRGISPDPQKALELFTKSAAQNNADAQLGLAVMYEYGTGVPKNFDKAMEWLHKAVAQKNAEAEWKMGAIYDSGREVPKNTGTALAWYKKAADHGNAEAQFRVGSRHYEGEDVPKDFTKAATWFTKAAGQGNINALNGMALLYANGAGVPKDEAKAKAWLWKADDQMAALGASLGIPSQLRDELGPILKGRIITITATAPLDQVTFDGVVLGTSSARVGDKYKLVKSEDESTVVLQDAGARLYRINSACTDYRRN